jgi:hypothetical protein
MKLARRMRWGAVAFALSALVGAAVGVGLWLAGPASGVPLWASIAAVPFGVVVGIAFVRPEVGLALCVAYASSPLSFYVQFRNTDLVSPYPATQDLEIDAAVVLVLAGAALGGSLFRSWSAGEPLLPALPVRRPLWAMGGVLAVTALIGLALRNPTGSLFADVVPFAELGLVLVLTAKLVDTKRKALELMGIVAGALLLTAAVRLAFYANGPQSFGVASITLDGSVRARLFQTYPFAWVLPLALAYALAADGWRGRAFALVLALACGVMVLLSFERGLWVVATIATLPLVAFGLWRRSAFMVPVLGTGLVALVVVGGLLGGGSGFTDPVTLITKRLAHTGEQLEARSGLAHKRQDEAAALWRTIRRDPAGWPLGHGLGAEYVGPTAIRESGYENFEKKHYSFNWYLAMAFRTGILGLAVAVWLVLALAAAGLAAFRRGPSLFARGAGLAVMSGLAGLAVIAPIDPYLVAHPVAVFEGLTVGLLPVLTRGRWADD